MGGKIDNKIADDIEIVEALLKDNDIKCATRVSVNGKDIVVKTEHQTLFTVFPCRRDNTCKCIPIESPTFIEDLKKKIKKCLTSHCFDCPYRIERSRHWS